MANVNFFSPDGGTTRYPIEDTEARSRIAGQQSLIKDTVGWTGKNWLKNTATNKTDGNVAWVVNANKSITINTSESASSVQTLHIGEVTGLQGDYILNGVTGGSLSTYGIQLYDVTTSTWITQYAVDGDSTINLADKNHTYRFVAYVRQGVSVSNTTIYPMLRKADITDPTYEPYHESVEVMYEEEIHGVNLLKCTMANHTINGVTFSVNNGVITLSGTSTGEINVGDSNGTIGKISDLKEGQAYTLNGCPANGSSTTYRLVVINENDMSEYYTDMGGGIKFTAKNTTYIVYIRANSGVNLSNLVFRPMLRKADIEDSTYRPYNPQAIQNQLNAQGVLGAKNLLQITATTQTQDGVTITVNKDSSDNVLSVVLNGTATSTGQFNLNNTSGLLNSLLQKYGDLIWSGCPSRTDCRMYTHILNGSYVTLTNNEEKILSASNNYDNNILVQYDNGVTYDNVAFYPMLRLASDPDDTYQPYAMTNKELTDVKFDRSEQGVLGAKNLCPATASTQTINGVTFTVNKDSDGNLLNVTVNGTATAVAIFILSTKKYQKNKYILTGCPKGGNQGDSYALQIRNLNNDTIIADEGNGRSGNLTGDRDYRVVIRIANGYTANNLVFKPMITLASDPLSDYEHYVPHAMTNKELTENTLDLMDNVFRNQRLLTTSDDLDNTNLPQGVYLSQGVEVINKPSDIIGWWHLINIKTGGFLQQFIIAGTAIYTRYRGGSPIAWSSWRKFTGTVVS